MAYNGKYPNRICTVSHSKKTGLVIVSNAGEILRLNNTQIFELRMHTLPKCGDDIADFRIYPPVVLTKELMDGLRSEARELQQGSGMSMNLCYDDVARKYNYRNYACMQRAAERFFEPPVTQENLK